MRLVPEEQEAFVAKKLMEAQGVHGSASLQKDDPTALIDTYRYGITFNLEEFVTVGAPSGIAVKPVVTSLLPIDGFLHNAYEPTPLKPHSCVGAKSSEEYVLEFPDSLKIVSVPKDFEVSTPIIDYRATYRKSANTLTVRRELIDKTATNVCSPQYAADYKKIMLSIAKDLKSQILLSD